MKLRPLHDQALIRRRTAEEVTPGGILIPDNAKEKPAEGEVLAVGPGRVLEDGSVRALDVKPGDRVLFSKYANEITVDGEKYTLVREHDILGVFET